MAKSSESVEKEELFSELHDILSAYQTSKEALDLLKDDGILEWQDYENLVCCVKQDIFTTLLEHIRSKTMEKHDKNILQTMNEYVEAKEILKKQDLPAEDIEEILYIHFENHE